MEHNCLRKPNNHCWISKISKVRSYESSKIKINKVYAKGKIKSGLPPVKSLVEEFKFIFISLRFMSIDVTEPVEASWNDVKSTIFNLANIFLKVFIFITFMGKMVIQIVFLKAVDETRDEATVTFLSVLNMIACVSAYKKRREMMYATKQLSQLFERLINLRNDEIYLRKEKYPFMVYISISFVFLIVWQVRICFFGWHKLQLYKFLFRRNLTMELPKPSLYVFWTVQFSELSYYIITRAIITLFCTYYIFTCRFIRIFLRNLLDELYKTSKPEILQKYLNLHEDGMKMMCTFDSQFSFHAFTLVVLSMINVFRSGYALAFFEETKRMELCSFICALIFYFSIQIALMISGIRTNESANETESKIQDLVKKLRKNYKEMSKLDTDLNEEDYTLSLWKMHILDRRLVVSSVGTLLTYGILLGTLGK
ncbi:hypothetical protein AVEN_155473-1 [Araneus ventricosus]|uniref:Gustatory receptor n=1 Tax=Araneus ventricosus TaxID=182803 RepID=A0A4Y2NRF4_ARAVE|nr:hypothetical protein AVEN_155473-1 [Araneus ventricosus]